jgi:GNAT superfamily N-acetyltransferase
VLRIRPAQPGDREAILALVPRLAEFGPPPWRDADTMTVAIRRVLSSVLADPPPDSAVFVAENGRDGLLGFTHLETAIDYFTLLPHGHISDLVVAPNGEGRGIARALIETAERWARDRGYPTLTLNVFTENHHARAVYRRLGFGEDTMRYVKALTPGPGGTGS